MIFPFDCHVHTGAKCCSIFSVAGLIFLLIIGSLLQKQPLYIKGPTDSAAAAQSCYQGGIPVLLPSATRLTNDASSHLLRNVRDLGGILDHGFA